MDEKLEKKEIEFDSTLQPSDPCGAQVTPLAPLTLERLWCLCPQPGLFILVSCVSICKRSHSVAFS